MKPHTPVSIHNHIQILLYGIRPDTNFGILYVAQTFSHNSILKMFLTKTILVSKGLDYIQHKLAYTILPFVYLIAKSVQKSLEYWILRIHGKNLICDFLRMCSTAIVITIIKYLRQLEEMRLFWIPNGNYLKNSIFCIRYLSLMWTRVKKRPVRYDKCLDLKGNHQRNWKNWPVLEV